MLLLSACLSVLTERISLHSLSGVATSAAFLTVAALGQMLVVTTGRGNIDLSIPSVITLAAYATVTVSGGTDAGLPLALAAAPRAGAGDRPRQRRPRRAPAHPRDHRDAGDRLHARDPRRSS